MNSHTNNSSTKILQNLKSLNIEENKEIVPMSVFYKITTITEKINYLLTTAHTSDLDVVRLPIEVKSAFENAATCLFELDMDLSEDILNESMILAGKKASDWYKNAQLFQAGECFEKYSQYAIEYFKEEYKSMGIEFDSDIEMRMNKLILSMTPIQLSFSMLCGSEANYNPSNEPAFDIQLQKQAKILKKNIYYMETFNQADIIEGFDFSYQEHLQFFFHVNQYLKNGGKKFDFSHAKEIYLTGDLKAARIDYTSLLINSPKVIKDYFENMGENKDYAIAQKMKGHLDQGSSFTAVGAAHALGILNELGKDGYKIEAVPLSERKYALSDIIPQEKNGKYNGDFFKIENNLEKDDREKISVVQKGYQV